MASLSNNFRNQFTDIVQAVFRVFGLHLQYYNPSNSEIALVDYLLGKYNIKTIVDVGANEGQFALKLLQKNNYAGKIISFEPVSSSFQVLTNNSSKSSNWIVFQSAVGDSEKQLSINISQNSVSSSLLKVNMHTIEAEAGTAVVRNEIVTMNTLDRLLKNQEWEDNLWLKIDVQGFEREVLNGAIESLKRAKVVQIELAVIPSYEQGPYLEEIISMLRSSGFTLYSIMSGFRNYKTGQMYEMEGFFVRS
ncbi:FkbM family methyltransferase [Runella limosa]|uniref:FkbM family methyltransferase n=1 Tax=Runella limosa TaxID=370978 RepID=UPI0004152F2E|nr:FkbM family methyltransferase [Runella limosa]